MKTVWRTTNLIHLHQDATYRVYAGLFPSLLIKSWNGPCVQNKIEWGGSWLFVGVFLGRCFVFCAFRSGQSLYLIILIFYLFSCSKIKILIFYFYFFEILFSTLHYSILFYPPTYLFCLPFLSSIMLAPELIAVVVGMVCFVVVGGMCFFLVGLVGFVGFGWWWE